MKKLFLLDGHALVYRAHYAFITRPLMNSKGQNVSAIQGFMRTVWEMLQNQKPTHIAVAFDPKGPTFRHEEFVEYKANRDAQPEDISFAIPWIRKILEAMNIPIVMVQGYEADDVIGTLSKQAEKEGFDVYMVTPDKDYGQLVSDKIKMYKPSRSGGGVEILGPTEICEMWGINRVDQVIDMLGLMGDSSDNIPGLPGIGPKTAAKFLQAYDSIDGLYENTDKLKGKQKEKVEANKDKAILSRWLATIDLNVPIKFDADKYIVEAFDDDALATHFKELEFSSLARTMLGAGADPTNARKAQSTPTTPTKISPKAKPSSGSGQQGSLFGATEMEEQLKSPLQTSGTLVVSNTIMNTEHDYRLVDTQEARKELIATLRKNGTFAYDSETTGLDATAADIVGMSFSIKAHEAWYVPLPNDPDETQAILEEFRPIFEDESLEKVGQNLKYDALILKNYGIDLKGKFFDTMIAHYLLEPEMRHGMNYLAETYLAYSPVKISELIGKGKNQITMREVPVEKAVEYAGEDADITIQLRKFLEPKLNDTENARKVFDEIEIPLVHVITQIEHNGVKIDSDFLAEYSKELGFMLGDIESKIHQVIGDDVNVASPKQVGEALFGRMNIPYPGRKMKSGQYSTDEATLTKLVDAYPVAAEILQHRALAKLKSTYVDALPLMVNPRTGLVHSSFNQALAATGRLSSNNPNLQNIPIKTPEGRKVREAFVPRSADHILLAADYSQVELRLIAEISNDEAMLEAFQKGLDIHTATAAKVYGVDLDKVTADQRRNAKTVNFSITYGAGATNLSGQLGISRKEAKVLIENYFTQYAGLSNYMRRTVEDARKTGYVETLMGRRRYLRDINSRNGLARSNSERVAINTPIQGTAADLIKIAMINIHKELMDGGYQSKMILQVHDELVFDIYKPELEVLQPMIIEKMKNAIPGLKVPILVEAQTGETWLEAH